MEPRTEAETIDIIRDAALAELPLSIEGGGTRTGIGRSAQTAQTLSSRGLVGITLYEPSELVIGARAGTSLATLERELASKNQTLAFEPLDYRPLLGRDGEPTIGGVAASNASGPRRIAGGAARDSLIGVRLVNGRGEAIKSGGRVMKNVTGLDLVKLTAGSWGTLGFLTEVTFKVLPRPERVTTLALHGLDDGAAVNALTTALGSPFEVTGAAHLPGGLVPAGPLTILRIEGFVSSVSYRVRELATLLRRFGTTTVLDDDEAVILWRGVRDAKPLAEPRDTAIWRVSVAPTRGPILASWIAKACPAARWFYDWGGGLVWIACPLAGDAASAVIRGAVAESGGHATLIRAPAEIRTTADIFQPMSEPIRRLTAGIKAAFDPAGIFEPGRMYVGI